MENDKFQELVIEKLERNDKFQELVIERLEKLEQGQNRLEERMLRLEAKVENEIEVGLKALLHDNRSLVESSFERIFAAAKELTDRQESLNMQLYKHDDIFRKIAETAAG